MIRHHRRPCWNFHMCQLPRWTLIGCLWFRTAILQHPRRQARGVVERVFHLPWKKTTTGRVHLEVPILRRWSSTSSLVLLVQGCWDNPTPFRNLAGFLAESPCCQLALSTFMRCYDFRLCNKRCFGLMPSMTPLRLAATRISAEF